MQTVHSMLLLHALNRYYYYIQSIRFDLKYLLGFYHAYFYLSKLHTTQKKEEAWYAKLSAGNKRAINEKRKKKYQQKEESLQQLKNDYDGGDFLNKVDSIVAVARFQGAAHGEEDIREEVLAYFEGEDVDNSIAEEDSDDEYASGGEEEGVDH